jgi:hypothetical protein
MTVQDVKVMKLLQGNSLANLSFNSLQSMIRASMNPVYEFPPLDGGILPAKSWTKDMVDRYPSNDGTLYAKYKFTVTNASSIMPGTYAAYANSMHNFLNSTSYHSHEWPPSGAFDKRAADHISNNPGWHQRTTDSTSRHLIIQLPKPILFRGYSLQYRSDVNIGHLKNQISSYEIHGSNDGNSWALLDSKNNTEYQWSSGEVKTHDLSLPNDLYKYFRYSTSAPVVNSSYLSSIGEWRLFGSMD